uniref:centromere protein C n=1 Tax=Erigeron canadensis TaxID=72917 RepID=UPI001CB89584|nr:centromere protein C [Erigeron canadensis]
MTATQPSNQSDPFQDDTIFNLFPRTFRNSKDAVKSNDLNSIHQFMTSLSLQNPDKHLEEARLVVNSGPELLNTKDSEAGTKENENLRNNRPALARKRAKFSLKPDTSQPSAIPEPSFQLHLYKDPDEFFAEVDKQENALKELKRLGVIKDLNEAKVSTTVRQLRPGISKRKPTYKHHVYSSQSQDETLQDNVGVSSQSQMDASCARGTLQDNVGFSTQSQMDTSCTQESLQDHIESPPAHYSQRESFAPNCQSKEKESTASIRMSKDKVNKLFKDLLSGNIDGNKALPSLIGIKPRVREKLHLPDISDNPRIDLYSDINQLIDKSMLPDTCHLSDSLQGKSLGKQNNPLLPLASTTPSKSPFSAISSFGKHLSKSVEAIDPFSSQDMEILPTKASEIIGGRSNDSSRHKDSDISGTLDSLVKNKVAVTPAPDILQKVSPETLNHFLEPENLPEPLISMDLDARDKDANEAGSYVDINGQTTQSVQENAEDMVQKTGSPREPNFDIEDATDNVQSHRLQDMDENVEGMAEKLGSFTSAEVIDISITEGLKSDSLQSAQTDANATQDLDASRPAQNTDIVPEQNQEHRKTSAHNRKKTTKARQTNFKKQRQSLAGAGSSWAAGVRRSSRIKRKPLETWKGERFVYGRIHNSLPTIIGIKYLSPGKSTFKVESFVSEKYRDLVEWAALH